MLQVDSRSPHGGRGLKLTVVYVGLNWRKSLPAWGAWIETERVVEVSGIAMSLPAWGAWIETVGVGETAHVCGVAPRMGGVD